MLERALNGARSCKRSSKPRAIVHRVIRDSICVCQRDSSHSIVHERSVCAWEGVEGWCDGTAHVDEKLCTVRARRLLHACR
eukprot:646512-Prymnesium_polylepis.1